MKKLLFASACVAAVAAFGTGSIFNSTGFEDFPVNTKDIGTKTDDGLTTAAASAGFYWWYQCTTNSAGEETSADSSMVKAFGSDDNLPPFNYSADCLVPSEFTNTNINTNYLELATEGGTLWRTAVDRGQTPSIGQGVTLGALGGSEKVYVDTMVQFTPTEDDDPPAVEKEDKLAIWLNVETNETTGEATTNLCVLAGLSDSTPQVHKITNAGEVKPGVWYRLTVKAIADFTNNDQFPGFKIWLDGNLLESDKQAVEDTQLTFLQDIRESLSADEVALIKKGSVFGSLEGGQIDTPAFMGVGFKGSGAIDDLQIGDEDPNFLEVVGSFDFTLVWGKDISAVFYTINGGEEKKATSGKPIECDPNAVVAILATSADPWYVVDAAKTNFTVTVAGITNTITTSEIASPIAGELTADVKTWATSNGKNLTPGQITACPFAMKAYLMNTDLSGEPGLQITSITEVEGGWQITVKGTQKKGTQGEEDVVTLNGINGQLYVKAAATLEGLAEATPATYGVTLDAAGVATITVTGDAKNFMKATVGVKTTAVDPE